MTLFNKGRVTSRRYCQDMKYTKSAIDELKNQLKLRQKTYKQVAREMGVGEETIKNWLTKSPEQLKLSNFEAICKIADTSVYDVFHTLEPESQQYQLDMVDEEVLTQNKELMLLAFLLVNGLELETIRSCLLYTSPSPRDRG